MKTHRVTGWVLVVAAVATTVTPANADVDVEIGNGDKVSGTLDPAEEVETFRVTLPQGAALSVVAKGKKTRGRDGFPVVTLRVLDEGDQDVAAGAVVATRKGAKLKKLVVPATGVYRVQVLGDGTNTGDYQVVVKWKSPRKATEDVDLTNGAAGITFATDRGALATFSVKPAKRSDARPRLVSVDLDGGGFSTAFVAPPPGTKRHKEKKISLPATGDYTLTVQENGAAGAAVVSVKIKPPKPSRRKVSVTSRDIGRGGGGDVARGVVLDEGGGGFVVTDPDPTGIDGAGIDVLPNALSGPTSVIVASSTDISEFPDDGTFGQAGPAVFFGPAGTQFEVDATVTIPFDPTFFDGDFTDLRVVRREQNGELSVVDPLTYTIDDVNGFVSFPTGSFTSFQVFGERTLVPGDLNADGFPDLVVPSIDADTRVGRLTVFFGGPTFGPTTDGDAGLVIDGPTEFVSSFVLGDFDGDRVTDLAAGVPHDDRADKVYIFFGRRGLSGVLDANGDADLILVEGTNRGFGKALAAGNLIGDAADELLVGSSDRGGQDPGRVDVFQGGTGFRDLTSADASIRFEGNAATEAFGDNLLVADVSGDGVPDLVVGTRGAGFVSVFVSPLDPAGGTAAQADFTYTERVANSFLGQSMGAGDVTGDGVPDLILGAAQEDDGVNVTIGATFVFRGGTELASESVANADVIFKEGAQNIGRALVVSDLDGNSVADVVFGQDLFGGALPPGRVFGFFGGVGLRSSSLATADFTVDGLGSFAFFGENLWTLDVNDDGEPDLIVAAPGSGDALTSDLYVFFGGPGKIPPFSAANADVIITGARLFGRFGAWR